MAYKNRFRRNRSISFECNAQYDSSVNFNHNYSIIVYEEKKEVIIGLTCVVESLRVESNGCVGVLLTFGEPTGLELPEVEVHGSGRLLPIVGEIAGGVIDDITIVGVFADPSIDLLSVTIFMSTVKVDNVFVIGEALAVIFVSAVMVATGDAFPLTVKDVVVVFVSLAKRTVD